ncbi:nucleic acid-binding protein [Peniophora sp. CONT]|nr:nucleic acid-binding protein [Peniophora sp. CONT]
MAVGKKRQLEDSASAPKPKKTKVASGDQEKREKKAHADKPVEAATKAAVNAAVAAPEEVDFPRGGGSALTPFEIKSTRVEAVKEANEELFKENQAQQKQKKQRRKSDVKGKGKSKADDGEEASAIRVEHLNYKRVSAGMKILAQVVAVQPLALLVSLPNQLSGHIPITNISPELTQALEKMDVDSSAEEEDEDEEEKASGAPELSELFTPGQYVRCIVTAVHAAGTTNVGLIGKSKDATEKASRRVELSLNPEQVNEGVAKADLKPGFALSASVQSVEDHGYILNLGVAKVAGFLSFKDAKKRFGEDKLRVGRVIDVVASKLSSNGRTCNVNVAESAVKETSINEVSAVGSILPGELVQCLVTVISEVGLVVQILGFFEGTLDEFHLPPGDPEDNFKLGQKLKARVLYDVAGASPPRFALSLAEHVLQLAPKRLSEDDEETESTLQEAYPIGTTLEGVTVTKVETERGLLVDVRDGLQGFVHISHVSDEHVVSLPSNSGAWKIGSSQRARVIGYYPLDGLLQLSFRPSVLEQKFLQVGDVQPGELVKGTIKQLTDKALFVSISGNVDAVVFPNHYADITLKQPQRRFKPGASIKCRVLVVDPERKRIALTAKKTLVESELPIITAFEDAKVGMVTHATIFRVTDKRLQIEFFNNVKGAIPAKEAVEVGELASAYTAGKPVRVRIVSINTEARFITASILKASAAHEPEAIPDISGVEIGSEVSGSIKEVHKENIVCTLQPSGIRALLSLKNLANARKVPVAQLRGTLKAGDELSGLLVVAREPEKGFVIVASKPRGKPVLEQDSPLTLDTVQVGQLVAGRVVRQARGGTLLKITGSITGTLHPTDSADDYEAGTSFPNTDTIVRGAVIEVNRTHRQLTLSSRLSRMQPDEEHEVIDPEIKGIDDLKVGKTVRGFVKSVAEHGLFVSIGRNLDARVQIKELFDEYVKDWKPRFQVQQLVKGRVLSVDPARKTVELTFRSGDMSKLKSSNSLSAFTEGQKIEGRIKKIEDYGLFIEIHGSKISGLCHKSELSDNKEADTTLALRSFRADDTVKAVIKSIDLEKKRISFSLKPSNFSAEDFEFDEEPDAQPLGVVEDVEMAEEESSSDEEDGADEEDEDEQEDDSDEDEEEVVAHASGSDEDSDEDEAMAVDLDTITSAPAPIASTSTSSRTAAAPSLQLKRGFQWNEGDIGADDEGSDASSDSDDEDAGGKKKRKKKKEIELDLTADLQTKTPDSNADFERVLLGSPNSSYLWIQYMSFLLQLGDADKAREVGRRAVQTISFREEQERLNVWIALLNLENVYGSEESLDAVFKDAARHCDSKTIHLRMATIFEQSEKFEAAEEQFKKTAKKFGQSSKVWTLFAEFYLKRGDVESARKLIPRSLQSLEKRKHLKTISRFAQLEYKIGDPERGKTIFEGIVDSHSKRWDLWSIYMDMEAGQQDIQSLRGLFNRVLALKMTSHKAKSFFKKWLELERRLGDDDGAEAVKAKAIEWTQRAANGAAGDV